MPRECSLCSHPDRRALEQDLRGQDALRTIAARWSVSKTALLRHRGHHLPPAPAAPVDAVPAPQLAPLSAQAPKLSPAERLAALAAYEAITRELQRVERLSARLWDGMAVTKADVLVHLRNVQQRLADQLSREGVPVVDHLDL
jgi:hypothetical protein